MPPSPLVACMPKEQQQAFVDVDQAPAVESMVGHEFVARAQVFEFVVDVGHQLGRRLVRPARQIARGEAGIRRDAPPLQDIEVEAGGVEAVEDGGGELGHHRAVVDTVANHAKAQP